jgi:hypothetical protein
MANSMLTKRTVESIARELLPGCKPKMSYRIEIDRFSLYVCYGVEYTRVDLPKRALILSWNEFSTWLKGELPPEWFPKPAAPKAVQLAIASRFEPITVSWTFSASDILRATMP